MGLGRKGALKQALRAGQPVSRYAGNESCAGRKRKREMGIPMVGDQPCSPLFVLEKTT
jgi:hypothetical protein